MRQSAYNQWTVGPIYYAALVIAETIGNGSQVLDITSSANLNSQAPAYLIYENGNPARIALFNYVSDPSGANDIQFTFQIGQGATPAQVNVKCVGVVDNQVQVVNNVIRNRYLRASSVTQKGNYTWAGQVSVTRQRSALQGN